MTDAHETARTAVADLGAELANGGTPLGAAIAPRLDSHDLTSAIAVHFAIAHALDADLCEVPAAWQFGAGPGAADATDRAERAMPAETAAPDAWDAWQADHADFADAAELLHLMRTGAATPADLVTIGDRLNVIGADIDL